MPDRRRPPTRSRSRSSRPASVANRSDGAAAADQLDWDGEVDVICVGTAGAAAAVAAGAIGLTTWVVGSASDGASQLSDGLGIEDAETAAYLESVSADITPMTTSAVGELPIRLVDGAPARGAVPTSSGVSFVGASLRNWAAQCLASRYGVLSTWVADPRTTTAYRSAGRTVETVLVGSVDFDGSAAESVDEQLAAWARHGGIVVDPRDTLQRLVFADGEVAGAVIDTPSGPSPVRARTGVVLSLGTADDPCRWPAGGIDGVRTADVAFVTCAASRFARLELLVASPRQ